MSSCYCVLLRRASRRVSSIYDEALAPLGITIAQFSLLRNIARAQPVSLTDLALIMDLDRSTVGRNTRLLVRRQLVDSAAGADQRESVLTLTPVARALLDEAVPLWEGAQHRVDSALGTELEDRLHELLNVL
jgi:DNA-binding MarR family transcriptional regulator